MTDQQINEAIGSECASHWTEKWDFTDPTAMRYAETKLTFPQRGLYVWHVTNLITGGHPRDCGHYSLIHDITPRIRAEAFLRTIGKWKDSHA
jgi:hypothetical protein